MHMIWNQNLTGRALAIAQTDCRYLRVMAGPGTGKTFAIKKPPQINLNKLHE
jgi:predicted ATPase with chaperone activity